MENQDFFTKGNKLYHNGNYEEALKAFDEAIYINPKYAEAFFAKGNLYGKNKEYKKSIKCFNKAIKIKKDYYNAYCNKAISYFNIEKYKKSLKCLNRAIKINSNKDNAWQIKVYLLMKIKKYDEALKCFENISYLNKKNYSIYLKKVDLLYILGKYDEAIKILENIINLDDIDDIYPYIILGNICLDIENINQSFNTVEKIIQNYEKNNLEKDKYYYDALILKGKIKLEEKDYGSAMDLFKNAIQSNMGKPSLLVWLAYSKYLNIEFQSQKDEIEYKKEIESIIRLLEKSYTICKSKKNDNLISYILYFLSNASFKPRLTRYFLASLPASVSNVY